MSNILSFVFGFITATLWFQTYALGMEKLPEPYSCYVMHGVVRVSLPAPGFRLPAGMFLSDLMVAGYTDDGTFRNCAEDYYVPKKYKPRG